MTQIRKGRICFHLRYATFTAITLVRTACVSGRPVGSSTRMTKISEAEFKRIVDGIIEDRESIVKHNPIGPDEEVLLWMLLNCLVSYLNLTDIETPCFTGKPDAKTYRDAILFMLRERREPEFDPEPYLSLMSSDECIPP